MAGDWIKIAEDLHEKPEVLRMAELLKTRPEHVAGYCVKFWAWVSRQTGDGVVRGVTLDGLESVLGLPHFLSMMRNVGWLEYIEDTDGPTIIIPNFGRHLSESAKKRAISAEKKRQQRSKSVPILSPEIGDTCPPKTGTREEKRREEKTIKKKIPKKEVSETFERFWESFSRVRRTKKADALRAWQQMGCEEISEIVIDASGAYARSSEGKGEFCAGPAPWLRAGRWDDDRESWTHGGGGEDSEAERDRELFKRRQEHDISERKKKRADPSYSKVPFRRSP